MQCPRCNGEMSNGRCADCASMRGVLAKISVNRCEKCGLSGRKVVARENGADIEHWYCYPCITQIRANRHAFESRGKYGNLMAKNPPEELKALVRRQAKYLKAAIEGTEQPPFDADDHPDLRVEIDRLTREWAESETTDDFNMWCRKKALRRLKVLGIDLK